MPPGTSPGATEETDKDFAEDDENDKEVDDKDGEDNDKMVEDYENAEDLNTKKDKEVNEPAQPTPKRQSARTRGSRTAVISVTRPDQEEDSEAGLPKAGGAAEERREGTEGGYTFILHSSLLLQFSHFFFNFFTCFWNKSLRPEMIPI